MRLFLAGILALAACTGDPDDKAGPRPIDTGDTTDTTDSADTSPPDDTDSSPPDDTAPAGAVYVYLGGGL